jgi:hypothetical protein
MSLGDVMRPRPRVVSARNKPEAARSTPQTHGNQDFPALLDSVSNAKLPARASWGKKSAKPSPVPSEYTQVAPPEKSKTSSNPEAKATMVATTFEEPYSKKATHCSKKATDCLKKATDWKPFEAKPRTHGGEEHDLIRLLHEGKFQSQKKGRQRITPRKKKFSTLKKKSFTRTTGCLEETSSRRCPYRPRFRSGQAHFHAVLREFYRILRSRR